MVFVEDGQRYIFRFVLLSRHHFEHEVAHNLYNLNRLNVIVHVPYLQMDTVDQIDWVHIELPDGHQIDVRMRHHQTSSIRTEDFELKLKFRELFLDCCDELIEKLFKFGIFGIHLSLVRQELCLDV